MDRDYLANRDQFHSRLRMNGPIRLADGGVDVIDFYGRLTRRRFGFVLPYHAISSPVEIRIRCHRFGLDGTLAMSVNGHPIGDFVFTDRSYPWGGIKAVIPQHVAEIGPLEVELEIRDDESSGGRFPEDLGVGVDWIEVAPLSRGVILLPSLKHLLLATAFPLFGFVFIRWTGGSFRASFVVLFLGVGLVSIFTALAPQLSLMAWSRLWVLFPCGWALFAILRKLSVKAGEPVLDGTDAAFLSRLFVGVALVQSVVIFFPNHAPPDLWNHIPQVEWLETLELTPGDFYRYSTSSDVFDDGHVRPHFGTAYGAPYPPWFYITVFAVSRLHDDPRFLVEFLPVLFGAIMLVLVFLITKAIWHDGLTPRLSAILLGLEISLWHHAHRVHAPGILGELLVLLWILCLVLWHRKLTTRSGMLVFSVLTAATLLSYPASLVQVSIMTTSLVLLLAVSKDEEDKKLAWRLISCFGLGLAVSFSVYYLPYAREAVARNQALLDRMEYDPPATFLFLRNQMRDTVRILRNGYPLYVVLSLFGWVLLWRNGTARFHKRVLYAAGMTYVIMLVLKDPVLLPRIFLHAKEDLFYAPIACILSAVVLARIWRSSDRGRAIAIGLVVVFLGLMLRDQYLNVDTLHDQPVVRGVEDETSGSGD